MKRKKAYIVEGWGGGRQLFYERSFALKEYFNRMHRADGWELVCENDYKIEHSFLETIENIRHSIVFQEIVIKTRGK